MKHFIILMFLLLWSSLSEAKPLLVQWSMYQPNIVAVERFVLYRGVNGGAYTPYVVISDLTATAYIDNAVKPNRMYCFHLRAVGVTGIMSMPSTQACARPVR